MSKPVIYLDPKGDNKSMQQFINLCKITGREFRVFSEYYKGDGAVSLNPAKDGTATHIADRIHHSFNWSEEHYEVLCYRALKKSCSLLINNNEATSFEKILLKLKEISDPKNKDRLFNKNDIDGIILRLENITESDFGKKLKEDGLSFKEIWEKRVCVYIGLPVLGYPKVARSLGKMILGDLAYASYEAYTRISVENEEDNYPLSVVIDELSAIITMDEFIELENKVRGVGVELTFALQSPSDIIKLCPQLFKQITENVSNWFILKQRDDDNASFLSKSIGTMEGKKDTVRFENGESLEQGSQRVVEELIAHPNIIKNLRVGQCVLLRHSPTEVDLINLKYIDPKIVSSNVKLLNDEGVQKNKGGEKIIKERKEKETIRRGEL